jgi:hypothetical protein
VLQKATSAGTLANPARTYAFLDAVTRSLVMNPELSELTRLAAFAQDVQRIGLSNIQFLTVPNGPDPNDINRLVWVDPADDLWTAVRQDRPIDLDPDDDPNDKGGPTPSGTSGTPATPGPGEPSGSTSPQPSLQPSVGPSEVTLDGVTGRSADADICE